jgi:photosystem II stability/assembly factor-like uncharacterized protein
MKTSAAILLLTLGGAWAAPTRDVTPDMGVVMSFFSEAFAFDDDGMLVFAGRGGFRRTSDGGKHWKRAMDGYVLSNGVEPYGNGFCQAPSAPSTVYSPGDFFNSSLFQPGRPVFRTDDLGRTWRSMGAIVVNDAAVSIGDCAVDALDPDILYVVPSDSFDNAALFKSTDGGRSFAAVGAGLEGLWSFRVRIAPTRPDTLYVIATGFTDDPADEDGIIVSIHVTHDGGISFAPLPASPADASRIYAHPTRDGMLFVSGVASDGQSRLFRSTDGGATFAPVGPPGGAFVAFDPGDAAAVYAVMDPGALYRSRDFGATFVRLPGPTANQMGPLGMNAVGVTRSSRGRKHVYVGTDRGVYRSDDGGKSFTSICDSYRGADVNDLALDAAGRLMVGARPTVVFRGRWPGRPYNYDSFGANLAATPPAGISFGTAVAPSTVDARVAVVATLFDGMFSTADGGATWTQATLRDGELIREFPPSGSWIRALFAPGSATRVYFSNGRALFRSDDAGLSFEEVFLGGSIAGRQPGIAVDPSEPDVIYLSTFQPFFPRIPNGLHKSLDGGGTVVSLDVPGDFTTLAIDPTNSQTVYAGNRAGGVLRSTDGGASWQDASRGLPPGETLAVAADPRIAGRVYAWVQAGGLFVSADAGGHWTAADTAESLRRSGIAFGRSAMAVDRVVPGRVYLGNSGVLQVDTFEEHRR